jgi:hypothetical protein
MPIICVSGGRDVRIQVDSELLFWSAVDAPPADQMQQRAEPIRNREAPVTELQLA